MQIFISWEADHVENLIVMEAMADNHSELRAISHNLERATVELKNWVLSHAGSMILELSDKGSFMLPADHATEIASVRQKMEEIINSTISMGMGMSLQESAKALHHAQKHGGAQVCLYMPEMEQELDVKEPNDLLGKAELRKDDGTPPPAPKSAPGGGGMMQSPEDAGLKPGNSDPSVPDPSKAKQPVQATGETNTEEAEREQRMAQGGDPKSAIMSALQEIKANGPAIEKLKHESPAAYAAVRDVVQAMIMMAQNMSKSEEPLVKDLMGPPQPPALHNTVEGFMTQLKGLPKVGPDRGRFVTQHMNHAPFLQALSVHPQGAQMKAQLNTFVNSRANAGFKPNASVAVAKDELDSAVIPDEEVEFGAEYEQNEHTTLDRKTAMQLAMDHLKEDPNYYKGLKMKKDEMLAMPKPKETPKKINDEHPVGTKIDPPGAPGSQTAGRVKTQGKDPQTGELLPPKNSRVLSGQIMGPTGRAVSSREPSQE